MAPFDVGRLLLIAGLVIAAVGGALIIGRRLGLGHLPGDISVNSGDVSFYFPIVTCIVISIVLTIVINLVLRLRG
jgi:hypothetical protein